MQLVPKLICLETKTTHQTEPNQTKLQHRKAETDWAYCGVIDTLIAAL